MNFFGTRKLTGEETKEELKCIRCGDRPNIVQIMLDPRRGRPTAQRCAAAERHPPPRSPRPAPTSRPRATSPLVAQYPALKVARPPARLVRQLSIMVSP